MRPIDADKLIKTFESMANTENIEAETTNNQLEKGFHIVMRKTIEDCIQMVASAPTINDKNI